LAGTPALLSKVWKAARASPYAADLTPLIAELLQFAAAQNPDSLFVHLMQFEFLLWKKDIEAALESARSLCAAFPLDARSHMALARCLAASARFAEAAEAGQTACGLDPGNKWFAHQTERWASKSVARPHVEKSKAPTE
jgi:hypothetical protein